MFYQLCHLFLVFFIASIIGYFVEIICCSFQEKKFVFNRGFLLGPYIPIYGVGTIIVAEFLYKYRSDPVVFFCMTVIICSFVEYFTSYIMEKIFKVRWWDYSNMVFNVNGRICLQNSLAFGLAGLVVIYTVYPFILNFLNGISPFLLELIAVIFFTLFMIDFCFTIYILLKVRTNLSKFAGKDATNPARLEVIKAVKKHPFSVNRLLQAFHHNGGIYLKEIQKFRMAFIEYRKKRKEKIQELRERKK